MRTKDGWSLGADVFQASPPSCGVAVLAHALMARRSEFQRPRGAGLATFLAERGWSVVSFDFRGHGDSRPTPGEGGVPTPGAAEIARSDSSTESVRSEGRVPTPAAAGIARGAGAGRPTPGERDCRYDDFVFIDLPAVCEFARWYAQGRPLVAVGHSLGGHVALAAAGSGAVAVDAIIGIGAAPWLPRLEPSPLRWLAKRAAVRGAAAVARRLGTFPARALRLGSDDEARGCVEDFERFAETGQWTSADGAVDYWASLGGLAIPVLQIVSDGDRFECAPECGRRLAARCGANPGVVHVTSGDGGSPPPSHMGLVTGGRARSVWEKMTDWLSSAVASPLAGSSARTS